MALKFYNTLGRKMEEFKPLDPKEVRMYHCGPTVYGTQHLGNLRAFVIWDILHRTLRFSGFRVKFVINITDVGHLSGDNLGDADTGEDRMTKGLRREGMGINLENMIMLGRKYEDQFVEDLKNLHVEIPEDLPRASEHIAEDIEIIRALEEKGFTYKISDGVYFDTSKDPDYGKIAGVSSGETESRIKENAEKKNPRDFALWKFNEKLGWDSPWGKGFPGWHIECSAMSEKYLSLPFDVHTGGIEHIPVHHTNEIAQSENARGKRMANYWLHNNHLQINGEKIAKSTGNIVFLSELKEKGYSPIAFRYFTLGAHYRSEQNFTWEALDASAQALKRLKRIVSELPDGGTADDDILEKFKDLINDDLGTPQALGFLWEVAREENVDPAVKKATLLEMDKVFALDISTSFPEDSAEIPESVLKLVEEREVARKNKDFTRSDELRDRIEELGYRVKDTDTGPKISLK